MADARKLRIVHVLFSFDTGGLEKGIATVAAHGSPGFEHVICCLTCSGRSEGLLPPDTQVVELRKRPGNSLSFLWRLSRVLKQLRPDVVHTRNWSGMDGIIAARLAGIGTVVHGEHGWGMDDPDGRNPKRLRIRRFLDRWVSAYTCVAVDMVSWLEKDVGVRGFVTQIYNGVDTHRFRPAQDGTFRRGLGLAPETFVVGTVGRLDPIKDHRGLIEAFRSFQAECPGAILLVAGDGPERPALEPLAGDGVILLGNRSDVPELLRALDVYVLNSRNEGISNTILEAMATGLPVVSTAVGGTPELVADGLNGRLVSPGSPAILAEALSDLLRSPGLRRGWGAQGRVLVRDRFSIASMVASYESVWRTVLGAAPNGVAPSESKTGTRLPVVGK